MNRVLSALVLAALLIGCDRRAPLPIPPGATTKGGGGDEPEPLPAIEKRIAIRVQASTWGEGGTPFDAGEDLATRLRRLGVEATPDEGAGPDGTLLVELAEEKGNEYDFGGNGTIFRVRPTLLAPGTREIVFTTEIVASTPYSVSGSLYEAAVEELRKDPRFAVLPALVATAIGIRSAVGPVLDSVARPDAAEVALQALTRIGFQPKTPREEASLALARNDYEACVRIGAPAVDPLVARLENWFWPDVSEPVVRALVRIGDRRAARPILERLRQSTNPFGEDDLRLTIALIEATAALGDEFALSTLVELAASDRPEIAAPAAAAAEKIRTRR